MKYLKYILEFKQNEKNTKTLYKDDSIEVLVVKTFDACKNQGKNTEWCSNWKDGFYRHNLTANMYRFNFSDGYKLRLTWDFITRQAAPDKFVAGTHWGAGGTVNGEKIRYTYIRPQDDSEPFLFDYTKDDDRQIMVKRIESIPQEVIDVVEEYQQKTSKEKDAIMMTMFKEIEKIKIVNVEDLNIKSLIEMDEPYYVEITIKYNNNSYTLEMYNQQLTYSRDFEKEFKNKYVFVDPYNTLDNYILDKVKEFSKK